MSDAKPVARKGDVKPVVSQLPTHSGHSGATGTWSVGPGGVKETTAAHASSGKPLVVEATCQFLYVGKMPDNTPVNDHEDVRLVASKHVLRLAEGWPLCVGDKKTETNMNGLEVKSDSKWRSA
jgi:hypothetical protein